MIYCVEDDASIRELIVYTLKNTGFDTQGFADGEELRRAMAVSLPELILLDLMLPQEDGLHILRRLKADPVSARIPVILVTAKGTEYDKVIGLDSGADDYLAKPFGMMELISRIKAVLRRTATVEASRELSFGPVTVNLQTYRVTVHGREVDLTLKEIEVLYQLLYHRGKVLTRQQLLSTVWGYDFDGETRTVDVHIRSLRQKLGEGGGIIETVRGVGYRVGGGE